MLAAETKDATQNHSKSRFETNDNFDNDLAFNWTYINKSIQSREEKESKA